MNDRATTVAQEQPRSRIIRLAATTALVTAICCAFGSVMLPHLRQIATSTLPIAWSLIALAVGLSVVYRLANAAVWKTVLGSLGCTVSLRLAIGMWIKAETCRWLPGSLWSMGSRVYLGAQYGLSKAVLSAGIALELAVAVASWGALALIGIMLYGKAIVELSGGARVATILSIAAMILAALAAVLVPCSRALSSKFRRLFSQFQSLSRLRLRGRAVGIVFIEYVLLGFANGVICWIVVCGTLGESSVPLGQVIAINAVAWLVGFFAVFAPAGLGVREATFAILFSIWAPFDQGLLAAGVWRLVQIGAEIICCIFAISVLRLEQLSPAECVPTQNQDIPHGARQSTSVLCPTEI
jgi:glycosyltransferase 2 family protein